LLHNPDFDKGAITESAGGVTNVCATLDCAYQVVAGMPVTLQAQPGAGNLFGSWSGACSGTGTTCTLTSPSNVNKLASASFAVGPPPASPPPASPPPPSSPTPPPPAPPADGGSTPGVGGGSTGGITPAAAFTAKILSTRLAGAGHRTLVLRVSASAAASGTLVLKRSGKVLATKKVAVAQGAAMIKLALPKRAQDLCALRLRLTSGAQSTLLTRSLHVG
jgi:hypothetical protein